MELKVFRLRGGKLEFRGTREIHAGDAIIEGETSMTEVLPLKESKLSDIQKALKDAFKKLEPDASERGLEILATGSDPEGNPEDESWG